MDWDVVLFSRHRNTPWGRNRLPRTRGSQPPHTPCTPQGWGLSPGFSCEPGTCWCFGSSCSTVSHSRGQRQPLLPEKGNSGARTGPVGLCPHRKPQCVHTRTLRHAHARTHVCTGQPVCTAYVLGNCIAPGASSQLLLLQISASPSWRAAIMVTPGSIQCRQWVLPTDAICRCCRMHARPQGSPCVPLGVVQSMVHGRAHGCICLTRAGQREPSGAHVPAWLPSPAAATWARLANPPPSIPHHLGRNGTSNGYLKALSVAGDRLPRWAGYPTVPSHVQWDQGLGKEGARPCRSREPGLRRRCQSRGKPFLWVSPPQPAPQTEQGQVAASRLVCSPIPARSDALPEMPAHYSFQYNLYWGD